MTQVTIEEAERRDRAAADQLQASADAGRLSHLRKLEAESIYILREAVAEFSHPVMLYSIGKDSSVMLRLAQKAFYPGKIPFPSASYRHQLQVSRNDRVSRFVREGDRRATDRASKRRSARGRRESVRAGNAEMLRLAEDEEPSRCAGGRRIQRGVWRRAARRRKIARQRAHLFVPRRARPMGSQESAARAVEPLQFAHRQSPRASAFSRSRTGRSSTSGSTSSRKIFRSCRFTSPKSAKWCCATARSW